MTDEELPPRAAVLHAIGGPEMSMEIEREASAVVREFDRTVSAEALTALRDEMAIWVATRILRALDDGRPPRRVAVRLHVELDGQAAQ